MIIANPSTLGELRAALADAEDEFERCQYIDYWPSALVCRDRWRGEIARIKAEIAKLESEDDERFSRGTLWSAGNGEGD